MAVVWNTIFQAFFLSSPLCSWIYRKSCLRLLFSLHGVTLTPQPLQSGVDPHDSTEIALTRLTNSPLRLYSACTSQPLSYFISSTLGAFTISSLSSVTAPRTFPPTFLPTLSQWLFRILFLCLSLKCRYCQDSAMDYWIKSRVANKA